MNTTGNAAPVAAGATTVESPRRRRASAPAPGAATRWPLRRIGAVVALIVLAAAVPAVTTNYWTFIAAQVVIYAVATLGLDVLFGRTGQLSMAHAAFMGIGAYVTAVASAHGFSVALQFVFVIIVSVVAGVVVAVPTLRLSGLRLALVTLLFGELFVWAIDNTTSVTGGVEGTSVGSLVVGGFDTSNPTDAYLFVLVFGILATAVTAQISRTQLGRRMRAVRDSELAARSAGVDVIRTKIVSFMFAAVLAGIAGWLYALVVGFVSPTTFDLFPSVYFLVAVLLGGAGTVIGAWLGAAYIVLVPQLFTLINEPNLFPVLGGAVLVVVALMLPDGLVSVGARVGRLGQRRRRSRVALPVTRDGSDG